MFFPWLCLAPAHRSATDLVMGTGRDFQGSARSTCHSHRTTDDAGDVDAYTDLRAAAEGHVAPGELCVDPYFSAEDVDAFMQEEQGHAEPQVAACVTDPPARLIHFESTRDEETAQRVLAEFGLDEE